MAVFGRPRVFLRVEGVRGQPLRAADRVLVLQLFESALQHDQVDVFRVEQLVRVLQPLAHLGQLLRLSLESALQVFEVVRELLELFLAVDQFLPELLLPLLSLRALAWTL